MSLSAITFLTWTTAFIAYYFFICWISKHQILIPDDEFVQFYNNKRGEKPSKARMFYSARGLLYQDLFYSKLSEKSFRRKLFLIQFSFTVMLMVLTYFILFNT